MEDCPNISQDRADSVRSWESRCECRNQYNGDFLQCRCGAAQRAGLVCAVCEAELVVRYNKATYAPFWACGDFFRTGCRFTRRINECVQAPSASATQEEVARTPPPKHLRKRPKWVTPDSPRPDHADNEARTTECKPVCLFPAEKMLRDTFIGTDLAANVVACGVPARVYSRPGRGECDSQHPKLYYEENLRSNEFCYWYKEETGRFSRSLGRKSKPVVLELFAGAGGMSLGLSQAGFDVKYAVEMDNEAADTLRSNHKDMVVFKQNVVDFLDERTKPKSPCYPVNDVDHIHASPPCQGLSQAKQSCRLTENDIQNNDLMLQFPKAVGLLRPTTASMETVKGIFSTATKKRYLQEVVAEFLKMEYQVRVVLLNAEDYGVPQDRKRVFVCAAQKGHPLPQVPMPLHPKLTVDKALGDLERIKPVENGLPVLENGEAVYDHSVERQSVHYGNMDYLQRGKTANTVRRRNGITHYGNDDLVTIRHRARLQSFPDSYHFCGRPGQKCDQIGNAVPVKLAEAVGRSIRETYR